MCFPEKTKMNEIMSKPQVPAPGNQTPTATTQTRIFEVTINGEFHAEMVYRLRASSADEALQMGTDAASKYYRVMPLPRGSNFYDDSGRAIPRPDCVGALIKSRCTNVKAVEVIGFGTEFPRSPSPSMQPE
jgi:hypothetical protein